MTVSDVPPLGWPDTDPDLVVAEFARVFPDALVWFGEFTGSLWALVRDQSGRCLLLEGKTPAQLSSRVRKTTAPSRRPVPVGRTARHRPASTGPAPGRRGADAGAAARPVPHPPNGHHAAAPAHHAPAHHAGGGRRGGWWRALVARVAAGQGW
ncbi:hypothetical protein [Actinomadura spongiicola]|nr:hypothetical protein [Actinomadura spongiicola]